MRNWRDAILNEFVPQFSKLTLVADPDSLLTEETLVLALHSRGFDLLEFADPIAFRYAYESRYRSLWDQGKATDLVVVLRLQDAGLDALPYDLLQAGRKLSFGLGELFPNLSYPVIAQLDRGLLDSVFTAQQAFTPARLGDNATKDFVLRHVFGIEAGLVRDEVGLLRTLLRIHYEHLAIPSSLLLRLAATLDSSELFKTWPVQALLLDDGVFFAFLQERWPVFLNRISHTDGSTREFAENYHLKYPGNAVLPLEHQDIRVYLDNLFIEGKLHPVKAINPPFEQHYWIRSGILDNAAEDREIRLEKLLTTLPEAIPTANARHAEWLAFAGKWAELGALIHTGNPTTQSRFQPLQQQVNEHFSAWLAARYSSMIDLPPTQPAMLHHVARRLARDLEDDPKARIALIVMDGLSLDQWVTVRQVLQNQDRDLSMKESATFAWIPTLTSVSRQAIFAGNPPLYFPTSINSTNNEANHWRKFWEKQGLSRLDIAYQRGLGDGEVAEALDATFNPAKTKVLGLVVDKVDKIMHGMQLGAAGMHNQIRQWCEGGFLHSLIAYLLEQDFQVWLTADHGNIECYGKGSPSEGLMAETRGERVRIYSSPELRETVSRTLHFANTWEPVGLPAEYYPLVAQGIDAFAKAGDVIVGHGGIAIEEVIVPLIKFGKNRR